MSDYAQDPRLYHIALLQVPGIGPVMARALISYMGTSQAVLTATKGQLMKVPGVGEVLAQQIVQSDTLGKAADTLRRIDKHKDHVLFFTDPAYPQRLRHAPDAPLLLYVRNRQLDASTLNPARTLAIVGTRKATEYGRQVTEDLVRDLAAHGVVVVSGLAYGIDASAHKACIQHHVPTWAVMATGLDAIYPGTHAPMANKMVEQGGALITELDFGTKPDMHQFPARNRIIAALADVTLIVEAAEKGGALITAKMAHDYGRKIMAVPGNINQPASLGANRLLADGKAKVFLSTQQFLEYMDWHTGATPAAARELPPDMPAEQRMVVELLAQRADFHIDELSRTTNLSLNKLAAVLLTLEFDGWVKSLPGKKFALVNRLKLL